jgi:hypothetical protein
MQGAALVANQRGGGKRGGDLPEANHIEIEGFPVGLLRKVQKLVGRDLAGPRRAGGLLPHRQFAVQETQ